MIEWIKKQWAKLAAGWALLVLAVMVYLSGRWRRNGELDMAAAKRELELNTARGAALQKKLDDNKTKQIEVVSDILAEQLALAKKQAADKELTDEEVIARLRADGLIR